MKFVVKLTIIIIPVKSLFLYSIIFMYLQGLYCVMCQLGL